MEIITTLILLIIVCISGCKDINQSKNSQLKSQTFQQAKYSLGQWSYHKDLKNGKMTTFDFINEAALLEISGVEFVNQFFIHQIDNFEFLDSLKLISNNLGIKNVLLLIDEAGDLGSSDLFKRNSAIDQHQKWILAAKKMACPSVRINARGDGSNEDIMQHCVNSIKILDEYAKSLKIEILIENHGGISNNGSWLASLIKTIDSDNVFALVDFDNWCIERENGKLWGAPCINRYDRYEGLMELMPFAKAISVKSFDFDNDGNELTMDYNKLFKIIKSHDFNGYLGIEYEGKSLPPREGIKKTLLLAQKAWNNN